mgnify:CR=1 FL=1
MPATPNLKLAADSSRFVEEMRKAAGAVGALAAKINKDLVDSYKEGDRQSRNFERGIGRLGEQVKSVGQSLSVYLTAPLLLAGRQAVIAYGEFDALKRGLTTVTGSAQATAQRIQELAIVAKNPGIGLREAIQADVRLRAVGISAETSKRALLAFGNAIAIAGGGKEQLDSVIYQLTQMSAKAKVLSQDFQPIIEAVPAVATAAKNLFGTVDTEVIQEKMKAMGINSTQFINMLITELEKLPNVTGGFKNALENLDDAFDQTLVRFGEAIDKSFNLTGNIDKLSTALLNSSQRFSELSPETQKTWVTFAGIAAVTGPLAYGFGKVMGWLPKLITNFRSWGTSLGKAFGWLTKIVVLWDSAKALFSADFSGGFLEFQKSLRNAEVFDPTFGLLTNIGNAIDDKIIGVLERKRARVKQVSKGGLMGGFREELNQTTEEIKKAAPVFKMGSQLMNWATGSKGDGKYQVPLSTNQNVDDSWFKTGEKMGSAVGDGIKDSTRKAIVQSWIDYQEFLDKIAAMTLQQNKIGAANYGKAFATGRFGDVQNLQGKGTTPLSVNAIPLPQIDPNRDFGGGQMLLDGFNENMKQALETLQLFSPVVGEIQSQFQNLFTTGKFSFSAIGDAIKAMLGKLIAAAIAAAILNAILGGLSGIGGGVGKLFKGFGGGAGFKSLLGSFSGIKLASGGLAHGPTLATIGDNKGASFNPEVISPLDKLTSIINNAVVKPIMSKSQNFSGGQQPIYITVSQDARGSWHQVDSINRRRVEIV